MSNTTPSGADALDVAMSKACIHSWDQSQFTSGDCDAVHPMFSRAFEAGYRAALSAARDAPVQAAQAVPQGWADAVNLARNALENYCSRLTERGVCILASAIMDMETMLAASPAAPQPAAQQGDEREAFDQWFRGYQCLPDDADTTQYDEAFLAFKAWQARAALAAQDQEAAPAAQGEPSDPLQGAANRLLEAVVGCNISTLKSHLKIDSSRAKRLMDAARAAQQKGASK